MKIPLKELALGTALVSIISSASAIPVSVTLGGASLTNLGGDPGVYYDAFSIAGTSFSRDLNYNGTASYTQNYNFTVGSTGRGSYGRVANFSAARSLSVNGQNSTLLQNGQVSIGSTDTLNLYNSNSQNFFLSDGLDRYQLTVNAAGVSSPNTATGSHDGVLYGQIMLYNVQDAPLAKLTGTRSLTYGQTLSLDASATLDPDKDSTLSYNWDFNDDGIVDLTTGANVLNLSAQEYGAYFAHTQGDHTIALTVRDNTGLASNTLFTTSFTAAPTGVPEPGTFALAAVGLAAVRLTRRRKAQARTGKAGKLD
jgi:hypothetical protein